MHFCVPGLTGCGGTSFLTTYLCSSRSKFVCQRMWPGPVVVCHLEQMRALYESGVWCIYFVGGVVCDIGLWTDCSQLI